MGNTTRSLETKSTHEVLTEKDIQGIMDAVYELLRDVGFRFDPDPRVLDLFSAAGCDVSSKGIVKISRELIESALDSTGESPGVFDRNGDAVDTGAFAFAAGMTCVNVIDAETGQRRPSTREDLATITRVADALPDIDYIYPSCKIIDRSDVHGDIDEFAVLATHTTKPIGWLSEFSEALEAAVEIGAAIRGGRDRLREKPYFSFDICPLPLHCSQKEIDQLFVALENDIPTFSGSVTLGGGNAPITIAGNLVIGIATDMAMVVLAQLIKKGCYFDVGTEATFMDPRTGGPGGLPEALLSETARNQIYGKLGFSAGSAAGEGGSHRFDQTAAARICSTMMHAYYSGAGKTGYLGSIEHGLTYSLHALLFCHEIAGLIRRMERGIEVNADTLAMETVKEVGLSGHYLAEKHTAAHCRTELWLPRYIRSETTEEWERGGRRSFIDPIDEHLHEILATHRPEPLPDHVSRQIDDILVKYGVMEG